MRFSTNPAYDAIRREANPLDYGENVASWSRRLRAMDPGEMMRVTPTGHVKRHGAPNTWVFWIDEVSERKRWGTSHQIAQDIVHYRRYESLPEREALE
jgi:hypothetical protein